MTDQHRAGDVEPARAAEIPVPPRWRDHFAGPVLQPGERPAQPEPPRLERRVEPVLDAGQVTPETVVRVAQEFVAREFTNLTPEERAARARRIAAGMRPLAADAEKYAARALDLGARGLAGLADRLERRRIARERGWRTPD